MLIHTPRPDILVHSWKSSILKSRLNISMTMVAKRMYSSWMRLNCQPELWVRQDFPFQDISSFFSPFLSLPLFFHCFRSQLPYSHSLFLSLPLLFLFLTSYLSSSPGLIEWLTGANRSDRYCQGSVVWKWLCKRRGSNGVCFNQN